MPLAASAKPSEARGVALPFALALRLTPSSGKAALLGLTRGLHIQFRGVTHIQFSGFAAASRLACKPGFPTKKFLGPSHSRSRESESAREKESGEGGRVTCSYFAERAELVTKVQGTWPLLKASFECPGARASSVLEPEAASDGKTGIIAVL